MQLARVRGQVVATVKVETLRGIKLLLVQLLDEYRRPVGPIQVAADVVGDAGPGDLVFVTTKKEAAIPLGDLVPVDLGIVGFVDEVTGLFTKERPKGRPEE